MNHNPTEPSGLDQAKVNPPLEERILNRIVDLMAEIPFEEGEKHWNDGISGGHIVMVTDEASHDVRTLQVNFGSSPIILPSGRCIQQVLFRVNVNPNTPYMDRVVLQQQTPQQKLDERWISTQDSEKEPLLSELWIRVRQMLIKGLAIDQLVMNPDEVEGFSGDFSQRMREALNVVGAYGECIQTRLNHDRLIADLKAYLGNHIPEQNVSSDSSQSIRIPLSSAIQMEIQSDIFWAKEDWEALLTEIFKEKWGANTAILAMTQGATSIKVEFHPQGLIRTIESELPKGVTGFIGGEQGQQFVHAPRPVGMFSFKGARGGNEDGLLIDPERKEYVLADGMGGEDDGELFSELLLRTCLYNPHLTWGKRIALAADWAYWNLNSEGGSTLAALKILDETDGYALVEFVHLGDSPILAFGRNGVFYQSEPHIGMEQRINHPEWVKGEIERAFRDRVEGELTPEMQIEVLRILITGPLGGLSRAFKRAAWDKFKLLKDDMEPTVVRRQVPKGTVVTLLSDGCFLTQYELVQLFSQRPFEEAYGNAMNLIVERQNTFAKLTGARERIPNESPHAILGPPDEQGVVPKVHLYKINGKGPLSPIDNHSGIFIQI